MKSKSAKEITMANQTNSTRRTAPAKKSATGIKALIMAASVGMTLGGWGILAASQAQTALASAPQSQAFVQSASPSTQTRLGANNSSTILGQAVAPSTQPRAIARTRSSR
jgi:hypothetical protein